MQNAAARFVFQGGKFCQVSHCKYFSVNKETLHCVKVKVRLRPKLGIKFIKIYGTIAVQVVTLILPGIYVWTIC